MSTLAVRAGVYSDRAFVRDLGRRSAGTSVSSLRDAALDDVLIAFDRLIEFVFTRRHDLLVAEEDAAPVGFLLLLYDIPDEVTLGEQAFVAYTAVEPRARGRGIARAMLETAEEHARAHGLRYMSLMVTDENRDATRLYDRAGFRTERRMMTKAL